MIFNKLKTLVWPKEKLLITTSWWPDSMLSACLMYNFFIEHKFSLQNLFFVHCNHKIRKESKKEEKFVREFFKNTNLFVVEKPKEIKNTESNLRHWRYEEFNKIVKENKVDYVVFWHNLTDRIESSFLNLLRWAWLRWFVSMKFVEDHHLIHWARILRPILWLTKDYIKSICDKNNISYVKDMSNLDTKRSLRNHLRLKTLDPLYKLSHRYWEEWNTFVDSMNNIYEEVEEYQKDIKETKLEEINMSKYREAEEWFKRDIVRKDINKVQVINLLNKLWIYKNIDQNLLTELVNFFKVKTKWHKYYKWVYFFISHWNIIAIKWPENFWENYVSDSWEIKKDWKIKKEIWLNKAIDEKVAWATIRFPQKWDRHKNKTWNQYCITQKIPVFWRNFVPIAEKDWKIIKVYKHVL